MRTLGASTWLGRYWIKARAEGVRLVGPDGLVAEVTKAVLETALRTELSGHLGYEHGEAPTDEQNKRNGHTGKMVQTGIGPVQSACHVTGGHVRAAGGAQARPAGQRLR